MNRGGKGTKLEEESGWTGAQKGGRGTVLDALGAEKQGSQGNLPQAAWERVPLACRTGHDSAWREFPEDTSGGPSPLSHGSRVVA